MLDFMGIKKTDNYQRGRIRKKKKKKKKNDRDNNTKFGPNNWLVESI